MSEYAFLLPISFALLLGVMSPGPSFLLTAQTAMAKSRSDGIAVSIGLGIGSTIFTLLASVGLYVVLESVPSLYILLKVVGGLYLCFLAYKIWKNAKDPVSQGIENSNINTGIVRSFFLGLVTQLSNPKTAIVFGSVYAAFLPAEPPDYSYLLLCLMAFIIDSGWYAVVVIVLSTPKAQNTYLKFKKPISRVASGFMCFMGLKLVINQ